MPLITHYTHLTDLHTNTPRPFTSSVVLVMVTFDCGLSIPVSVNQELMETCRFDTAREDTPSCCTCPTSTIRHSHLMSIPTDKHHRGHSVLCHT